VTVPVVESDGSAKGAVVARPGLLRRVMRRPLSVISLAFLLLVTVAAVFAPQLAPYGPEASDFSSVLSPPTSAHWLGTDSLGRDILSRLMFGARPTLLGVVIAVAVTLIIGVPIGLSAAMSARADRVIQPLVDLMMSIPGIIVLLMVLATFNQNIYAAMTALGVLTAPAIIRVVRAAALTVVNEPYVEAARVYGLRRSSIAARHVLPRVSGPVLVNTSLIAAGALVAETGLNYLNLGVKLPAPSWGGMVADASTVIDQQPWLLVPTGGILALTITAFVLLGDGVRDAATEGWSAGRSGTTKRARRRSAANRAARNPGEPRLEPSAQPDLPAADSDTILRVSGLSVSFRRPGGESTTVVQDVSFDIKRGETVAVVGESGCGKTITGLAILGLLPGGATATGRAELNGSDLFAMSRRERAALRGSSVAFISQEPMSALDPLYPVGSQLAESVRVHKGLSRREAKSRAVELLEKVKINDPERVTRLYPHEISGGMAQRVAIAIALAGDPDLLIADEPTTALDVTVQAEIVALLQQLQQQTGMAILLISHDWGVVGEICSRALVMYAGEVVERGLTRQIFAQPLHPYSAGLLAANPHFAKPGEELSTIPGGVPLPQDWPVGCHFHDRCAHRTADCAAAAIPLLEQGTGRQSRCIHVERLLQKELADG
jgi:peptide/nickel transport system permease protein